MECERVREEVLALLPGGEGGPRPELVARHLEGCAGCRIELEALQGAWALLGRWPESAPGPEIRGRLVRGVRRQLLREAVLTVRGWTPPMLAAVIGVGLSLAVSLVVPYSLLVSWCRAALQLSEPDALPYLLAGAAYAVPLALGVWLIGRQALGGPVIGSLEASVLFLAVLSPYVIAQCREFAPVLQVAFFSGLAGGALVSSLGGGWLARFGHFGRF